MQAEQACWCTSNKLSSVCVCTCACGGVQREREAGTRNWKGACKTTRHQHKDTLLSSVCEPLHQPLRQCAHKLTCTGRQLQGRLELRVHSHLLSQHLGLLNSASCSAMALVHVPQHGRTPHGLVKEHTRVGKRKCRLPSTCVGTHSYCLIVLLVKKLCKPTSPSKMLTPGRLPPSLSPSTSSSSTLQSNNNTCSSSSVTALRQQARGRRCAHAAARATGKEFSTHETASASAPSLHTPSRQRRDVLLALPALSCAPSLLSYVASGAPAHAAAQLRQPSDTERAAVLDCLNRVMERPKV